LLDQQTRHTDSVWHLHIQESSSYDQQLVVNAVDILAVKKFIKQKILHIIMKLGYKALSALAELLLFLANGKSSGQNALTQAQG
jgi:hypothetical protein